MFVHITGSIRCHSDILLQFQVAGAPSARSDALGDATKSRVLSEDELEQSLAKLRAT